MSARKNKEPMPDFSDVRVKLKPILGISPGTYLTVLYSVILLVVLFLLLLYPGIRKNGTVVDFTTSPGPAGVWIDGAYQSATPCRVFVPRGTHQVEIRKVFFKPVVTTQRYGGRIFGSLFFPLRKQVRYQLDLTEPAELIKWTAQDFASWGMNSQFFHDRQLPRSLSEAARALSVYALPHFPAGGGTGIGEDALQLIEGAALYVDSAMELKELLRAAVLWEAGSKIPSSLTLQRLASRVREFHESNPSLPLWLESAIPARRNLPSGDLSLASETMTGSDWYTTAEDSYIDFLLSHKDEVVSGGARTVENIEGIDFVFVPGGEFLVGRPLDDADVRELPYLERIDGFYLSKGEVTNSQYRQFLAENPDWRLDRLDALIGESLITEDYLFSWKAGDPDATSGIAGGGNQFPEGAGSLPVVNISYHAAEAYCLWLSGKLPQRLSSYEIRLPMETEWEWAARIGGRQEEAVFLPASEPAPGSIVRENRIGVSDLWGNVWEWCADWYYPMKHLLPEATPESEEISAYLGSEKVVRGGAWANDAAEIEAFTRGSQPPSWCTPYLGFRTVLAPKTAAR